MPTELNNPPHKRDREGERYRNKRSGLVWEVTYLVYRYWRLIPVGAKLGRSGVKPIYRHAVELDDMKRWEKI